MGRVHIISSLTELWNCGLTMYKTRERLELAAALLFGIVVACLVLAICVGFTCFMVKLECNSYMESTGRETKMNMGRCYVKHGDSWYTMSEYKYILVENREEKK